MRRRPSPSLTLAVVALVCALGGTALADPVARVFTKKDGKRIVKVLPKDSLTGVQIRESKLKLPKPAEATLADMARTATTADRAADADRLQGNDAAHFAQAGHLKFAIVNAAGTLVRERGATAADIVDAANNTYRVTFTSDVSSCSYTATPAGPATGDTLSVEGGASPNTVRVDADAATGFHLQVIC